MTTAVLVITMLSVVHVADTQLKEILDRRQTEVYEEKLAGLTAMIQRSRDLYRMPRDSSLLEQAPKNRIIDAVKNDEYLKSLKKGAVFPFLLTDGGLVIHPAPGEREALEPSVLLRISRMKEGEFVCTVDCMPRWFIFKEFKEWNWVAGFTMPLDIKYSDAKKFRALFIAAMSIITLIVSLLLVLMIMRITGPVIHLTGIASRMARGDLDQAIDIRRNDEIGVLADSFSEMRDAVREKLSDLDRNREELEQRVEERTHHLVNALLALTQTRELLDQTEKMADLGKLIAGVAHEVNTPLGIGVTEASFLESITRKFSKRYAEGNMTRSDFEKFLNHAIASSASILKNLGRAADLIQSFKQVAVDRASEEKREFDVRKYINEILLSFRADYKRTSHTITVNCPEGLRINSWPGIFSQVITHLVQNAIIHGFRDIEAGEVTLSVHPALGGLILSCEDNGIGMEASVKEQIFDPFFTTKRAEGGTGMGLHIVHNLITRKLGGEITCKTSPGNGTLFTMALTVEVNSASASPEASRPCA